MPRAPSRRRRIAAIAAGAIMLLLLVLWAERRPIAGHFVDRKLASRGVPARYRIADLGLGRQRLTNVVIGDPADPDLVADWIETNVGYGLRGPALAGVRAGHVRLRGRVVNGRVSFGALDRLLPASRGGPMALPAINADLADARLRLETPYGIAGIKLTGSGRLDDGFSGRLAVAADQLAQGRCAARGVRGAWHVRTQGAGGDGGQRLRLDGPLNLAMLRCGGAVISAARSDVTARLLLGAPLRSSIEAHVSTGAVVHSQARAGAVSGILSYDGDHRAGQVDLNAAGVRTAKARVRLVRVVGAIGDLARVPAFDGLVAVAGADLSAYVPKLAGRAAGTPVGPLLDRAAAAAVAAARAGDGEVRFRATASAAPDVIIHSGEWRAVSGAGVRIAGGPAGAIRSSPSRTVADATVTAAGGGLPDATIHLRRPRGARAWRGVAAVAPYDAGDARIALSPIAFAATDGGAWAVSTRALLSGPLADGRVESLSMPIELRRDPGGRVVVGPGCVPVAWRRLAVGPLVLDPSRLTVCPAGAALVTVDRGGVGGGARVAGARLGGRLGGSPLALTTGVVSLDLAGRTVAAADLEATIGAPGRTSRLSVAMLRGALSDGPAGSFAGGGGQIGAVPLILSAAQGRWAFANGALHVTGSSAVSDAAASPRFKPMIARGIDLRLASGTVTTTGTLVEPVTGTAVADVAIAHRLRTDEGHAAIDVPHLAFRQGFQPDLLTPLTFGVVADVRGTVAGQGRIDWNGAGVTSRGRFGTEAIDLAAAFGPVTGLATTLTFTDLLGLRTEPNQVATVHTVNPGIQVEQGVVRYALEGPTLIRVEGARWPFAGGELTLEPTLLDFSQDRERRMTFRVVGAEADRFLQQFDFQNIQATGVFDGALPMVFDQTGGRIEGGDLKVREGGGSLAYVGALTQEQLGVWGNLAFQALKSLRYRSLSVRLNGPLAGEMVTDVRFAGVSQGAGAKSNFLIRRLQRLPFVFNIRIKAPFRGLLDSAQSFYDPRRLIQRNLPALLDEQRRAPPAPVTPASPDAVQPSESGPVR